MNNPKVDLVVFCCDMHGNSLQTSGMHCDIANSCLLTDGPAREQFALDEGVYYTDKVNPSPPTQHPQVTQCPILN